MPPPFVHASIGQNGLIHGIVIFTVAVNKNEHCVFVLIIVGQCQYAEQNVTIVFMAGETFLHVAGITCLLG